MKVCITNGLQPIIENGIIVRLPEFGKFLLFDFDYDFFSYEFINNAPVGENLYDFIGYTDKYDDILKSSIRNGLTTLSYIFYITTNSIAETVKRLNSLDLEKVVLSMIYDDVIDKFKALYIEQ